MSASLIKACNEALFLARKGNIETLEEGSLESEAANMLQQSLREEMAEWTEWPELITRKALAVTTNDRPAEWLYCYQAPDDLSDPIAIRGVEDALTTAPLAGPHSSPYQDTLPARFIHEGGKVYTNVETATLVYSKSVMDTSDMQPMTRRAFIDEMAYRLGVGLKSESKLIDGLSEKAEVSRARAIADAENRNPKMTTHYVSDAELARMGLLE